jgi:hypothetical protein
MHRQEDKAIMIPCIRGLSFRRFDKRTTKDHRGLGLSLRLPCQFHEYPAERLHAFSILRVEAID